jgi:hypothetical protein
MTEEQVVPESPRVPLRWWPLGAAAAMTLTVLVCLVTSWDPTWNSHPAYWISLVLAAVGALGMGVWAWRTSPGPVRPRRRTWLSRAALVVVTVIPAGSLFWLRPLGADAVALDALADGHGVEVQSTPFVVRMDPDLPKGTGLVFYPGAKVDPRAYARILRPVAEAGYTVVIIKFPFNLAVLSSDAAEVVVGDAGDDIHRWVVGGHSLGGVMAATYASTDREELSGLLLYAAYPSKSLADRTALDVLSVYGTNDGLATVADIDKSKADLPPDTRFVPIVGGIHAYFGDYGPQSGDGTATITREDAQAQIAAATIAQMDRVDAAG